MSRIPSYRRHRASGQAIVTLTDPSGNRRDFYLGRHGSPESKAEYGRIIGEWTAAARRIPRIGPTPGDLTVNELIFAFWQHAEQHYRHADGTPTSELEGWRYSLRPLKERYGHTVARDFGPLGLKAVRQSMIDTGKICRREINKRVGRIRRMFKWAVSEELVPESVYRALATVAGLEKGRTTAHDHPPVEPVPDSVIERTLPKLNRHVAGMVRFQRLAGCRPQDVCNLRRCDIDTSGAVWLYTPPVHKTAWRNKAHVVAIGPKAQAVLAEFPTEDLTDYIFSPARMTAERMKSIREVRVTAVQPSQINRAKRRPKRKPGERYSTNAYSYAVSRAAAFAGAPHWHPNQLRHARGTEVRREYGLEGSQVVLGHSNANITQVYAQSDAELASRIALASG